MPTMLVEIAVSRCPPASGVLLATGCASTSATPGPAGLARPYRLRRLLPAARSAGCANLTDPAPGDGSGGSAGDQASAGQVAHIQDCPTERLTCQREVYRSLRVR